MKKSCLLLALLVLCAACGAPEVNPDEGKSPTEIAVRDALYDYHRGLFTEGECDGLGYVIMGEDTVDGKINVYTICSYGVYEEKDDAMCKTQGHACLPMVVVLDEDTLGYIEVKEPVDNEDYFKSVAELFPNAEHQNRIFQFSMEDFTAITSMEADCISKYLKENDMEMAIKY